MQHAADAATQSISLTCPRLSVRSPLAYAAGLETEAVGESNGLKTEALRESRALKTEALGESSGLKTEALRESRAATYARLSVRSPLREYRDLNTEASRERSEVRGSEGGKAPEATRHTAGRESITKTEALRESTLRESIAKTEALRESSASCGRESPLAFQFSQEGEGGQGDGGWGGQIEAGGDQCHALGGGGGGGVRLSLETLPLSPLRLIQVYEASSY